MIDKLPSPSKSAPTARIGDLRQVYLQLFACDPPGAFGSDLLKLSISYEIQKRAHGGLSPATRRELLRVAQSQRTAGENSTKLLKRVGKNAALVREWNGQQYRVRVVDGGYEYNGENYGNLSQIARLITGTRWNGPRFFGLRESTTPKA